MTHRGVASGDPAQEARELIESAYELLMLAGTAPRVPFGGPDPSHGQAPRAVRIAWAA